MRTIQQGGIIQPRRTSLTWLSFPPRLLILLMRSKKRYHPPPRRHRRDMDGVSLPKPWPHSYSSAWTARGDAATILACPPPGYNRVEDTEICVSEPAGGDCNRSACVLRRVPRRNRTTPTSSEQRGAGILQASQKYGGIGRDYSEGRTVRKGTRMARC